MARDTESPPLSPGQRKLVAGVTFVVLGAAVALIAFSLRRPSVPEFPPSSVEAEPAEERLVGPRRYTVDASSSDAWRFFDFSAGTVVEDPGPREWDLAFRRFHIVANGGEGFPGRGGLLDLGSIPLDSVEAVPRQGYVGTEAGTDTTNAATEEWYDYSITSHLLRPRPRTYAVRTADGRYAVLRVVSYYCPGAQPGCVTFRYLYQGDGSVRMSGPGPTPGPEGRRDGGRGPETGTNSSDAKGTDP